MEERDRTAYLGGSDIGAILGLNPYRTAYRVWCEKNGVIVPEDIGDKPAVYWGNRLEKVVGDEWARRRKSWSIARKHKETGKRRLFHPSLAHLSAEPDFFVYQQGRKDPQGLLEVKTTGIARDYDDTQFPAMHMAQLLYQAGLYEIQYKKPLEFLALAVLINGREYREYEIDYDCDAAMDLIDTAIRWWDDNVLGGDVPTRDFETVNKAYGTQTALGYARLANAEAQIAHLESIALKKQIKELSRRLDDNKAILMSEMRGYDTLATSGGDVLATWRSTPRKTVDLQALRESGIDLEPYMRETAVRRLLIK